METKSAIEVTETQETIALIEELMSGISVLEDRISASHHDSYLAGVYENLGSFKIALTKELK